MSRFAEGLREKAQEVTTENGAKAIRTTGDGLVDLLGSMGALRGREDSEIIKIYKRGLRDSELAALRLSFYARDIRGGLGERDIPRVMWRYMAEEQPEKMRSNIKHIPEYGRWDDLYVFIGTELEDEAFKVISEQYEEDMINLRLGRDVSLMGKWLASENASSKETKIKARKTMKALGLTPKEYRKTLSALREKIGIIETRVCQEDFTDVKYSQVPSLAMMRYRGIFENKDSENFRGYIERVVEGKEEIKATTLYPYNILEAYNMSSGVGNVKRHALDEVLEEQWKAQPNYVEGENNFLVMADTSGSMMGRPMATSLGLAVYFAERNKGAFKDLFMLFSEKPYFVELEGDTLLEKVASIPHYNSWNTDISYAINEVLRFSKERNVPQEEMPKSIIIISDMEFDEADANEDLIYYDIFKDKFKEAGYEMPQIVFWNVESRQDVFHTRKGDIGVQLVSGQSPSTFKVLIDNLGRTPIEVVESIVNSPRYEAITI